MKKLWFSVENKQIFSAFTRVQITRIFVIRRSLAFYYFINVDFFFTVVMQFSWLLVLLLFPLDNNLTTLLPHLMSHFHQQKAIRMRTFTFGNPIERKHDAINIEFHLISSSHNIINAVSNTSNYKWRL